MPKIVAPLPTYREGEAEPNPEEAYEVAMGRHDAEWEDEYEGDVPLTDCPHCGCSYWAGHAPTWSLGE
jgi:hypothetical protein